MRRGGPLYDTPLSFEQIIYHYHIVGSFAGECTILVDNFFCNISKSFTPLIDILHDNGNVLNDCKKGIFMYIVSYTFVLSLLCC